MTYDQTDTFTFLNGRTVNRIGYGAMRLTGQPRNFGPYADWQGGIDLLRRARQLGVNHIDTARAYGPHENEKLIADALVDAHGSYGDMFIASKGGVEKTATSLTRDTSAKTMTRHVDESLANLRTNKIDGVDAPSRNGIAMCQTGFVRSQFKRKEASMSEISILAIDLAKHSFQVCATTVEGVVVFNRKYTRGKLEQLLTEHPICLVAMEACATSHHWGRFATELGHDVKLIPPIYVKPFVKRSAKNDANDAAAIATAVRQPGMRFVQVKSQEQQSHAVLFRTHQTLTRQRAQLIITLRGHLAEHGVIVAKGNAALLDFENALESEKELVPVLVLEAARLYYHHIEQLAQSIATLERQMAEATKRDKDMRRLRTMPGIGPINAAAFMAFAPPMESFRCGRDFAAWLGLVPKQLSTGGKTRLGRVSKMGQSDLRRLLITGATVCIRWARWKGIRPDSWLGRLLERKQGTLAAVALANKMARILWAMVTKKQDYRGGLVEYA